ncbi:MAG: hypothetical protein U1F08_06785 [Steroidobacteraceae bacterium]
MSSTASAVLRLELRPWPVADRVAAGLVVAAALVIEAVAARTPDPRPGLGVLALALLGAWLWYGRRSTRGVAALSIGPDGRLQTEYQDGRQVPSDVLPGTRLLGRTVALRWRAGREVRQAWLTPWDAPDAELRELAVRLRTTPVAAGA